MCRPSTSLLILVTDDGSGRWSDWLPGDFNLPLFTGIIPFTLFKEGHLMDLLPLSVGLEAAILFLCNSPTRSTPTSATVIRETNYDGD